MKENRQTYWGTLGEGCTIQLYMYTTTQDDGKLSKHQSI